MDKEEALSHLNWVKVDGKGLYGMGPYISWCKEDGDITLDDEYTIKELEFIIWLVQNNAEFKAPHTR